MVRQDLNKTIIPTSHGRAPAAPNFFVEAKAPRGGADVAKRQACLDGAVGARAMHSLQNYMKDHPEAVYDGNAHSFSSTYHAGTGTLQLYAHHVTPPVTEGGRPEYHMTQLKAYALTSDREACAQGITAFRNTRDLARLERENSIRAANARAMQAASAGNADGTDEHDELHVPRDSQPLIFSRYAGPGSHRYPVGFSGDAIITWDSLRFQPEFTATASNIGYGWWSHDIGGHMLGYRDDELAARWVQLGAFSPLLRLHSSDSRWTSKEPWNFRQGPREAMRSAMQLRHRLLPYIYSHNVSGSLIDPQPLIQPMYWEHPQLEEAYQHPNQYKFGSELMVCPIVDPVDSQTNLAKVTAWLPQTSGNFVDILSGRVYSSGRVIDLYRPLSGIPVLAEEGAIIPLDGENVPNNGCKNPDSFEVLVVVGADGKFDIWEDLRDDTDKSAEKDSSHSKESALPEHRQIHIQYDQATGQLTTKGWDKKWSFRFPGFQEVPTEDIRVFINDVANKRALIHVESASGALGAAPGLVVQLEEASSADDNIRIELGPDPELTVASPQEAVEALLLDAQLDFKSKDLIWGVVTSKQSIGLKLAHLQALAIDKTLAGALFELLSADSRIV